MIFVGDLVKALKDNITIVIDLGPDENSYSHQVIRSEERRVGKEC